MPKMVQYLDAGTGRAFDKQFAAQTVPGWKDGYDVAIDQPYTRGMAM